MLSRTVRKDNTIWYEGNRYTVPTGTYKPGLEVAIEVCDGKLLIYDVIDHNLIAEHSISLEKGRLFFNGLMPHFIGALYIKGEKGLKISYDWSEHNLLREIN
ncbi:Mu transposase domain-containing protein [Tepidibacillus decaturensis]|uniref:Mu transposase domain-containing protein n=2 Tax=Tepidibacillus TaxID=1494427 RepID=UPI00389A75DA